VPKANISCPGGEDLLVVVLGELYVIAPNDGFCRKHCFPPWRAMMCFPRVVWRCESCWEWVGSWPGWGKVGMRKIK
jgi:hypothetical protein